MVADAMQRERSGQDLILEYLAPRYMGLGEFRPYANVVLAAGFPRADSPVQRTARCQLAIALETLALAQRIHRLKMVTESPTDATLAGTAVLLGDHHFARAAQLVTQLANPPLLEAFAHVLKIASTQEVASLVAKSDQELETRAAITTFGIRCGAFLPNVEAAEVTCTATAWKKLADPHRRVPAESAVAEFLTKVPPHQRVRWHFAAEEYLAWPCKESF